MFSNIYKLAPRSRNFHACPKTIFEINYLSCIRRVKLNYIHRGELIENIKCHNR